MPNIQNIKRNTNNFSFIDTVASLANNKEYRSGYQDLIEEKTNDKTYFWTALSAVGEEIGNVIYENVLNYVNNVANINTCRLRALTSIAKILGVTEFAVLKNINTIPEDVLTMMDVFSINKAHLLNVNLFNTDLVRDILSSTIDVNALSNARNLFKDTVNEDDFSKLSNSFFVLGNVSEEKYENYVEECFYNLLINKIFQTYGSISNDFIYENLSANGFFSTTGELAYDRSFSENGWRGNTIANQYTTFNDTTSGIEIESLHKTQSDYGSMLQRYKNAYNIPASFNETQIVNNIEKGLDFLDNYQGGELSVLQLEIQERAKTKFSKKNGYSPDRLDTRYSYYNEKEVKDYIRFIDSTYLLKKYNSPTKVPIEEIDSSYLNWTPYFLSNNFSPYDLDSNYSVLSNDYYDSMLSNVASQYRSYKEAISSDAVPFSDFIHNFYGNVFSEEVQETSALSNLASYNIVRIVARILKDICLVLVDIREKLKTQAQRNYMTGTKLLIEYILDEYLANTLINTYGADPVKALDRSKFGAQIIEYNDTTEYFNIGLDPSESLSNDSTINAPYFSDLSNGGFSGSTTGIGLVANEIRNFYLSSLNIKSDYISSDETYYDFMSAVYETGITKTYVGRDGALIVDKDHLMDNLSTRFDINAISARYRLTEEDYDYFQENWYFEDLSGFRSLNYELLSNYAELVSSSISVVESDFAQYNEALSVRIAQQESLILRYKGTDYAYYPWYNYKNQTYPTYQAHPYLYNFIQHENTGSPIENAFYGNSNEDLIYELQTENISVYLGELGNILRVWRNGNFDYSGYKSRYERSFHNYGTSNSTGLYSVTHYDGIFYPPAIDLYKKYWKNELQEDGLVGFDLLSAHMTKYVDEGRYVEENLDIPQISSMWHYYSHLGLTKKEREIIVNQLLNLSADILEMSDAKWRELSGSGSEPYDVYKYGLDYNNNSIVLLKKYNSTDPSQTEKKETTGQLWIKFNSHPIGFPAFLKGSFSSYSQIVQDPNVADYPWNYEVIHNANVEASTSQYGSGQCVNNVYDFDLAGTGRYFTYAIENPSNNVEEKRYENAVVLASRIYQERQFDYITPNQERAIYFLAKYGPSFLYPTNDGPKENFNLCSLTDLSASDYEFDGFFQNRSGLYAGYVKRNVIENTLSSIEINAIAYPGEEVQSLNSECATFAFSNSKEIIPLSNDFVETEKNASIRLGYSFKTNSSSGTFALAIANKINDVDGIHIQDFIGRNAFLSSNEDDSILSNGYGFTDYKNSTGGISEIVEDKNCNSFDRFDHLISLYSISENAMRGFEDIDSPALYALNSDASYVPLYCGIDGQNLYDRLKTDKDIPISYNKEWQMPPENYIARQSIELLGYSFQKIDSLIQDKENGIFTDTYSGKKTSFDSNGLTECSLRVYEDFEMGDFIVSAYNSGQTILSADNIDNLHVEDIDFLIDLSSITQDNMSSYSMLLMNTNNGQNQNPILAGPLTEKTISSVFYDVEPTITEEYIIDNGIIPNDLVRIVGTPNPFDKKGVTFSLDYSNHIFNVSNLSCKFEWDDESRLHLIVTPTINDNRINFSIQSENLLLLVYKNSLEEFERYHYLEPFNTHPFNAAMSSWNAPWKNQRTAWKYLDGWNLSDGWQSSSEYPDIRYNEKLSVSYLSSLSSDGVFCNANIGHLPLSAYDSSDMWKLSISKNDPRLSNETLMETIELSSLSSFGDNYYFDKGQLTFKISEEDEVRHSNSKYPPTIVENILFNKFNSTNGEHVEYDGFDLSNTYVFRLDDPNIIAKRIGKIAVPMGTLADTFNLVYEDYLSDSISVDTGGPNFLNYCEVNYESLEKVSVLTDLTDEQLTQLSTFENESISSMNAKISSEISYDDAVRLISLSGYALEESEYNTKTSTIDYCLLSSIRPDEIADYLKLYVNWKKTSVDGNDDQIELFFNLPNLFLSPYSFKNKTGFAVEYKNGTYLKLNSGEDGYLYVILQFKYYDVAGKLCGVRDLPILTYHIYNVSDDKPKFLITKTFEIDNSDGKYTYPGNIDEDTIYLIVDKKTYSRKNGSFINTSAGSMPISSIVGGDETINCDLYPSTKLRVISPIPLKYVDFELIYEQGELIDTYYGSNPENVFEPTISKPGEFIENDVLISGHFDSNTVESNLEFTIFAGTSLPEENPERTFPIEILKASAEDFYGNKPTIIFVNGYISIDDYAIGNEYPTGQFLGKEYGKEGDRYYGEGFVLEEINKSLIRMYSPISNGMKLLADTKVNNVTTFNVPLKTTGERLSRYDQFNNRFIIL